MRGFRFQSPAADEAPRHTREKISGTQGIFKLHFGEKNLKSKILKAVFTSKVQNQVLIRMFKGYFEYTFSSTTLNSS